MSDATLIDWTDATWPLVAGCEKKSSGCAHCWAIREARRLGGNPNPKINRVYGGLTRRLDSGLLDWAGPIRLLPERLDWPRKWREPRRVFVCSASDLFHPQVPDTFIAETFAAMHRVPRHTYQVLTKWPERALAWYQSLRICQDAILWGGDQPKVLGGTGVIVGSRNDWPKHNVWFGFSAETQDLFDERWESVRQIPAAVRWCSMEPMLESINIHEALVAPALDWLVVGGESGPKSRPMAPEWPSLVIDQGRTAGVRCLFKQCGDWSPLGDPARHRWKDVPVGDGTHHRLFRVGKRQAGRLLYGALIDEYPRQWNGAGDA